MSGLACANHEIPATGRGYYVCDRSAGVMSAEQAAAKNDNCRVVTGIGRRSLGAFPVQNLPTFPSVRDVPGLPPKFGEMPIVNPGWSYYICDDGFTGVLSDAAAINRNANCKVAARRLGSRLGADPVPTPTPVPVPAPVIQQVPIYIPLQPPAPAPAPAPQVTTITQDIPPVYLVGGALLAVGLGALLAKF